MTNRIKFVDIARGLGIILVVFGHAIVPEIRNTSNIFMNIYKYIYIFHMPLFFFISGYVFEINKEKYSDKKLFIKKKAQNLLIPYLTFSIISYIVIFLCLNITGLRDILINAGYKITNIGESTYQILLCSNNIDKHIWFVYALFFVFLFNIFIKNKSYIYGSIIVCMWIIIQFFEINAYIPSIIEEIIKGIIFFIIGRNSIEILEKIRKDIKLNTINFVLFIIGCLLLVNYSTYIPKLLSIILRLVIPIFAIIFIMHLSTLFEKYLKKISSMILYINKYVFEIYLMHQPFVVSGVSGIILKYLNFPYIVIICLVTFLGFLIPILIYKFIIAKSKLLMFILFGKSGEKSNGRI